MAPTLTPTPPRASQQYFQAVSPPVHLYTVPEGHELEVVLGADYFAGIYARLVPMALIDIVRHDHAFEGRLRVVSSTRNGVRTIPVYLVDRRSASTSTVTPAPAVQNATLKQVGSKGWCVVANGEIVTLDGETLERLGTREDAEAALARYNAAKAA